ncbi:MAG: hypothetical protein QM500_00060 [Methylococcales bacterium]
MQKLSFNEAKILTALLGFQSKREYQAAILPPVLYKNPSQSYPEEFKGWDDYLGKSLPSENKSEILDVIKFSGIESFVCWNECVKANIISSKLPKNINKIEFSDDIKLLFKQNKHHLPESVFVQILKREKICNSKSYKEYITKHQTNLPQQPTIFFGKPWSELLK